MSLPKKVQEWYQSFLLLAEEQGIDIHSPDAANAFQSIHLTTKTQENFGTVETEYRNDPIPLTVPQKEGVANANNAIWRFENLKPLSQMSEDQIQNLYQLAQEGRVSYAYSSDALGDPHIEWKLVYTGTDGLPHFSGPLSHGPLIEDRNQPMPADEKTKMEATFPDAPDPVGISEISTRFVISSSPVNLTFAMDPMEADRRNTDSSILTELQLDRKKHPHFYTEEQTAAEREKIVAHGIYQLYHARFKTPEEYNTDGRYDQQIMARTERNILSVSTANMSLEELVEKGLIRREDGTPYTHGNKPWDACAELAGEFNKTVHIYRPGENGGEPVLDGTAKLVMVGKVPEYELTRTERSARKEENELFNEKAFRGVQANKTTYGGVRVCAPQMAQLRDQPCSEFLHFEPREDGSFTMRYKLPERGRSGGNEFNIRENVNYLMRSVGRLCIDKEGNVDLSRFTKYSDIIASVGAEGLGSPDFAEYVGVPKEKQEDFGRCMTALYDEISERLMPSFGAMTDDMLRVQTTMAELYQPGTPVDADKEKLLLDSYGDFRKKMDNIRKMASMDPATETEVFYELDCGTSSSLNSSLLPMVNEYRQSKGQPLIEVPSLDADNLNSEKGYVTRNGRTNISFQADAPDDPDTKTYRAFNNHSCFTVKAKLNEKDVILSMETSAPPAGKLMFSDPKGETAIGIYKNTDELAAFHRARNMVHVENLEALVKIKKIRMNAAEKNCKLRGSHILDTKLRTAVRTTGHSMEELGKRLSSWKVDNPLISSSSEFKAVKQCFSELSEAKNTAQEQKAMQKLNLAAQIYLDYKDPKGSGAKEAKLSNYAKTRLEFVRDILDYSSAKLHQSGIEPKNFAEMKATGAIDHIISKNKNNKGPERINNSPVKNNTKSKALGGP